MGGIYVARRGARMKIEEYDNEYHIRIHFCVHRAVVKTCYILKSMYPTETERFEQKKAIIEDLNESNFYFKGRRKELIKAWSEIDERFVDYYSELYPRGGPRKNSGRPRGVRTDKTERLNLSVTPKEKAYILNALERYRERHVVIDKVIQEKQTEE